MSDHDHRHLDWAGCLNVRDLGGLPLGDGGETRFGSVVRADSIRALTDDGWRSLSDHGVTRVVDLRFHAEVAEDPPPTVDLDVRHISVLPEPGTQAWEELDVVASAAPDGASATRDVYLEWLDRFAPDFARAFEAVATAPAGPVVVHCHGGKDRTGLVSALLLRLAGVPADVVAADYALSEVRLQPRTEAWLADAVDDGERAARQRMAATPAIAMVGVLEALDQRHGGVAGYLRHAGVADDVLERAQARLRP